MSRDTIIDDQNRRTQALFESLLSPTVASDATQEAADAEFSLHCFFFARFALLDRCGDIGGRLW